jgi:hypothetical protein
LVATIVQWIGSRSGSNISEHFPRHQLEPHMKSANLSAAAACLTFVLLLSGCAQAQGPGNAGASSQVTAPLDAAAESAAAQAEADKRQKKAERSARRAALRNANANSGPSY